MSATIGDYASVRAGHPFRGTVPEDRDGPAIVVQMRDVSPLDGINWDNTVRANLHTRKEPDWLQPGDIIFVARGARNYAFCIDELPGPAVCSQYFFLIRLHQADTMLAEFLAWQINQMPAQRYLTKNAEGTDQRSIRRGVLEALPITVPSLEQQRKVVALAGMARQERKLMESLIQNRDLQMRALVTRLLNINDLNETSRA
ncbi:MAG: restriction endonuclease subunit S [Janthinobacterium lividum]